MHHEVRHGEFIISCDPARIDADAWRAYLTRSYWSPGIPRDIVARAIANSLCFGIHHEPTCRMVGGGRVVTDRATFAYMSDVYVLEEFRGRDLGKRLVEAMLSHPDLQGLRRFCLMTGDAHGLYARYGFAPMKDPMRYMERVDPDPYRRSRG